MRKFEVVLLTLGLLAGFSAHAAEQSDEALITQCEQQAKSQGVEDIDAFIATCLDDKKGYAKE